MKDAAGAEAPETTQRWNAILPFAPVAVAFLLVFYGLRPFSKVGAAERYRPAAEAAALAAGIDANLVLAVMTKESGGDPLARSPVHAIGLMQLRLPAAADAAAKLQLPAPSESDLYDPNTNVKLGATYLKMLIDRYRGSTDVALAAYLKGPEWVARVGGPEGVRRILQKPGDVATYVKRVLELAERLKIRNHF
jgi:soluble lytic murein transglycosylase-like protein